jgi:acetoin utilization deacetylase AcuC-like enzyme
MLYPLQWTHPSSDFTARRTSTTNPCRFIVLRRLLIRSYQAINSAVTTQRQNRQMTWTCQRPNVDQVRKFHAELPNMSLSAGDIHPEDPRRIHAIFEEIRQAGLVGSASAPDDEQTEDHCWRIAIRPATRPEILLIHTVEHYDFVKSLQRKDSFLKLNDG